VISFGISKRSSSMTLVCMSRMIPTYLRLEQIICLEDELLWKKLEALYGTITILLVANITVG